MQMTYREAYDKGRRELLSEEADQDALILLEFVTGASRNDLYIHPERELSDEEVKTFLSFIERRKTGEPVQYITGKTYIYGLEILCDKNVLIPRFDTEILIDEAIRRIPKSAKVLDLCTGSGAIALCVKHEREDLTLTASDISNDALCVAKKNSEHLNLNVTFIESDMFENIDGEFDCILSNPPYIVSQVVEELESTVKDYEPRRALDGGTDGLDFYRIIAKEAKKYLKGESLLIMEIGYDQGESVSELLSLENYKDIEVIKDLNGLNRVVSAKFGG